MTEPDSEPMDDSIISDEYYRQALRDFAAARNDESLEYSGENGFPEQTSLSAEAGRLS
jgi:hypothetical protein